MRRRTRRPATQLERGGLRITTTLDLRLQKIAEKWVEASTVVPHRKDPAAAAKALGFDDYPAWMRNLENKNVRNGALVALDYQTGELVAYVGSAKYYATRSRPEFQPQYDVVGKGYRQPGSAFKPFNYAVGIDDGALTAGSMFMDTATDFGGGYTPERRRQPRARPGPRPHGAPVLAEHPVGQGDGSQQARPRVRSSQGLRDDLPDRQDQRRPGARAGRRRRSGRSTW